LSAHSFLRVVLWALDFAENEGNALKKAPQDRAYAKPECRFKHGDLDEAEAHIISGERPVCWFLVFQIPQNGTCGNAADKDNLFKRGKIVEVLGWWCGTPMTAGAGGPPAESGRKGGGRAGGGGVVCGVHGEHYSGCGERMQELSEYGADIFGKEKQK
jgi:hypothetical protein